MSAILVRLDMAAGVTTSTVSGGEVTGTQVISEQHFRAQLMLTPDGDIEKSQFGYVHLNVEMLPKNLPPMTFEETREWLRDVLIKMLEEPSDPE